MNKKCVLPLVFFLGNMTSQMTFANTSTAPANGSPMEALVNTTEIKTETSIPTPAEIPTTSQPATTQTLTNEPASVSTSTTGDTTETSTSGAIDCNFTIPEGTSPSSLSPNTVVEWANYTATETFTYDFRNYDKQFKQLQQCYTTPR